MKKKNTKHLLLLLLWIVIIIGSFAFGFYTPKRYALALETPAQSGTYVTNVSTNLMTGITTVTLSNGTTINYSTSVTTQEAADENNYSYFVFPQVYEDGAGKDYSYIGTDGYKYILTGFKVDDAYKTYFGWTGSNISYYSASPLNGYQSMWEPTVNVFSQGDWVDVSSMLKDNQTTVTFSPVYGKCIYVQDPFENMYYDGNLYLSVLSPDSLTDSNIKTTLGFDSVNEYKEFLYYYTRRNVTLSGNEGRKKYIAFYDSSISEYGYYWSPGYSQKWTGASDKNDGHDENNAVATLDRVYELISERTDYSAYHYVAYMKGDLHEVRIYNGSGKPASNVTYSSATGNFTCDAVGTYSVSTTKTTDSTNFGNNTNKKKGITFTSTSGVQHALIKRLSTYSQNWYGSVKFDNMNYKLLTLASTELGNNNFNGKLTLGSEENLMGRSSNTVVAYQTCEFTRRSTTTGWATFRVFGAKTVVTNGTNATKLNFHMQYGSTLNYLDQTVYTIGGNSRINYFYGGSTSSANTSIGTINGNFTVNIIENANIASFWGGASSQKFQQTGNRTINIRGGTIGTMYGGGLESILNGDIVFNITGGTIGYLYGGGKEYYATVYGDITLNIANATINQNIYGGGQYASVIKGKTATLSYNSANGTVTANEVARADSNAGGNVTLNIKNTTVKGSIYGSGQGMVNSISRQVNTGSYSYGTEYDATSLSSYIDYMNNTVIANIDNYSNLAFYNDPLVSPKVNEDGSITGYQYLQITGSTPASVGGDKWSWRFYKYSHDYFLSVAQVENSVINLYDGATIKKNVYGGGNLGTVKSDTNINVKDGATVEGIIYTGGDGSATVSNINLYNPYTGDYPKYKANGTNVNYENTNNATTGANNNLATASSLLIGSFKWTNNPILMNSTKFGGIYLGASHYNVSELNDEEKSLITLFGENKYVYSSSYAEVGKVYGNTNITVDGGTIATVYGGSNLAIVEGNTNVTINGGTITTLYGGGNNGQVTSTNINFNGGTVTNALYGGGRKGNVSGDIHITTEGGSISTLYTGCNEANVLGNVHLFLEKGSIGTAFGGNNVSGDIANDITVVVGSGDYGPSIGTLYGAGNDAAFGYDVDLTINNVSGTANNIYGGGCGSTATVSGDTVVTVHKGTFDYIFGGGNLAKVVGNTNVTVGNIDTNEMVTVNHVVYGGGRGLTEGDASGIITVEGESNVTIAGMNTLVQNYGSTTLGGVSGDVNVYFENYRKNNSTNPYVVMNGIDRATRVELNNSYMALENLNANNKKEGIKNIDYLCVPAGSGLKVTASGEIKKDFEGGGTFYLDSMVTLRVGGNILGKTELVINPDISDDENTDAAFMIRGGIENSYLIVAGTSSASNLYCTDRRYSAMMRYDAGHYYLESDVPIDEQISEELIFKKGIEYDLADTTGWADIENVYVYRDGIFSANIDVEYNFAVNTDDTTSYRNVYRTIYMKESDVTGNIQYFPQGTIITMIVEKEQPTVEDPYDYYVYTVPDKMTSISLSNFTKMEDSSVTYSESHNIVSDGKSSRQGTRVNPAIYKRSEQYRFVIDYSYANELLPAESYMLYMDIADNSETYEALELVANNIVTLTETRKYGIALELSGDRFLENSVINIGTKINIEANPMDRNELFTGIPLYARLSILTPEGGIGQLPASAKVYVDSGSDIYEAEGGVARFTLVNGITQAAYQAQKTVSIDLSDEEEYSALPTSFALQMEAYVIDDAKTRVVEKQSVLIHIVRPEGGGLIIGIQGQNPRSSAEIEELLDLSSNNMKEFAIRYVGDLNNPYFTVKLQKKDGNNYSDIAFSGFSRNKVYLLDENSSEYISANFAGLASGTYRLVFDLYGFGDALFQESAIRLNK